MENRTMRAIGPEEQAEARGMVSDGECEQIVRLAAEVERLINSRLKLGFSGGQIGAIAAAVRSELRDQIDAAIYHQRSTKNPGVPPL
jgi:hypothetical protein